MYEIVLIAASGGILPLGPRMTYALMLLRLTLQEGAAMLSPMMDDKPRHALIEHSQDTRAQSVLLCQWARDQRAASVRLHMLTRELVTSHRGVWQRLETLLQRFWRYDGY